MSTKRLLLIIIIFSGLLAVAAEAPEFTYAPPQQVAYWSPPAEYQWTGQSWQPPKGFAAPTEPWSAPEGWGQPQEWAPPPELK